MAYPRLMSLSERTLEECPNALHSLPARAPTSGCESSMSFPRVLALLAPSVTARRRLQRLLSARADFYIIAKFRFTQRRKGRKGAFPLAAITLRNFAALREPKRLRQVYFTQRRKGRKGAFSLDAITLRVCVRRKRVNIYIIAKLLV